MDKSRSERLMPNGIPRYIRIYDNFGMKNQSIDRYTVIFTGNYAGRDGKTDYVTMSSQPFHPQGVCMHGQADSAIDIKGYAHLGKPIRWQALPEDCKRAVLNDYTAIWALEAV